MEPGVRSPPPPPPPPPSAATTLLGKYQLGQLLGRGSFAKVYKAHSLIDNTSVAVKMIDKSKTINSAMEPRIISEIAAMKRLQHHPNILKIHEVMATKTKICLVMELASGGELFSQVVRHGRLPESIARRYLHQLVSALSFCHENGVAHRDVKPQNLLLDSAGNLKVTDFGLSALPEQLKDGLLHTACGTPAYAAPEVACRRGGYDGAKADAWSCGVILFVLLSGYHPFDDSNLMNMYKCMHRREYQFPSKISKSARNVIYQLLNPNPHTRMSIEELKGNSWFKKGMKVMPETSLFESELVRDNHCKKDSLMNAFDIISMSSGLDLSGLFESGFKRGKRFTSKVKAEVVSERAKEIGRQLGYRVEKGKGGSIGLGKGRLVLMIQVMEITDSLVLVEVKLIEGGSDFEEIHWEELKSGFDDILLSWHNDAL